MDHNMKLPSWNPRLRQSAGVTPRAPEPAADAHPVPARPKVPARPVPWWIPPTAVLVIAAAGSAIWWLLSNKATAAANVEVVRTVLLIVGGVGAAITLMLTFRRQRHLEIVAASTEHDAAERRVTELYTKAVEQLGNAQAPVRLGGLYALERLAQNTPELRQTVVDVICSYVRMPYTPPRDDAGERQEKIRAAQRAARTRGGTPSGSAADGRDPREEKQVRLTAQRILADHLRYIPPSSERRRWRRGEPANPRFWPGIRVDLSGATLLKLDFRGCRIDRADFSGAAFAGDAYFRGATFAGDADFRGATFTNDAYFSGATFTGEALFDEATFTGEALFGGATFTGEALFGGATFTGEAFFGGAAFTRNAFFGGAAFTRNAFFGKATFTRDALFAGATFTGDAFFRGTIVTGETHFGGATITGNAFFSKATSTSNASFDSVVPSEDEP
ncbi:pentapeptide repeat-containing protein [Nonomuraea sp. NPDC050202]|uniref:pentapeptide repeat-containing protein n=1 Tax=Nonomuraea sp. NPDC050202 TaxID=3155035 RepID=UPI0033C9454E